MINFGKVYPIRQPINSCHHEKHNNQHIQVIDDFRIIRENKNTAGISEDENLFVNVNKITWYFSANDPRTVIEWDRGFEKEILAGTDQGFTYA